MTRRRIMATAAAVAAVVGVGLAGGPQNWSAALTGYEEVPALSTGAGGGFKAFISPDQSTVNWELRYEAPSVTQAHLHFGQTGVNGGVSVFLCTNLGNGPVGTQPCPADGGVISGTFTDADVVGPAGQGIAAGELEELIAAIRAGRVYANVHTTANPAGLIRGQLAPGRGHGR
jgi:hypothetical protein